MPHREGSRGKLHLPPDDAVCAPAGFQSYKGTVCREDMNVNVHKWCVLGVTQVQGATKDTTGADAVLEDPI